MTSRLAHALALAADGFHVFPLLPGRKVPPSGMRFKDLATRDPERIAAWWTAAADAEPPNIGIHTGRFADDGALLVLDVDCKKGKDGDAALLAFELDGLDLPDTREAATPSGGRHLFFRVETAVRQSAGRLGPGLDVRSRGGYVVAAGSVVADAPYRWRRNLPVAPAPEWLVLRCGLPARAGDRRAVAPRARVAPDRANHRAQLYLARDAPLAIEGHGGDQTTYKIACRLKDFGVAEAEAGALMLEHWNGRCAPPWDLVDLLDKVANAYRYGVEPLGAGTPEADFEPVPDAPVAPPDSGSPYDRLNREFAFVLAGGGHHILRETTDAHGGWKLEHLNEGSFHKRFAAQKIVVGKKEVALTADWMEWRGRRSYDGLVFAPERPADARFYNLWRGFAVQPWPDDAEPTQDMTDALAAFLEHARANVCLGDNRLFRWLIGYFAHLVQRPWDKPLVALVFRGGKGVGKNALVERVGALLGGHFLLTSNRRYLVGSFNGHLENCLLFALDEAFWSGDKQAEGILKDLITGQQHVIEHKGKEHYTVDNRTRVAIIGNEDWLVPASHDERRFAVFDVGEGRKQDREFFRRMREGMERGGYRLLLRHLQRFDLAGLDLDQAPSTRALLEQKLETLKPFEQWWFDCLSQGRLLGSDFAEGWPGEIEVEQLRVAFERYSRQRHITSRNPSSIAIGKALRAVCGAACQHTRVKSPGPYIYRFGDLGACRAAFDRFIGHAVEWPA